MNETAEQYKARFAGYVQGKDPVAMQREAPSTIARLIEGLPEPRLKTRPAPGKWSPAEIIAHLAECEVASAWRYRQMLEHDAPALLGFNQELWAQWSDYGSWPPAEALAMFRLLRQSNLKLLASLTPEQWERHGNHAERGRITVRELCRHIAAHDINHIEQIRRILGK